MTYEVFEIIRGTTQQLVIYIRKSNGFTAVDLSDTASISLYVAPSKKTAVPTITKSLTSYSGSLSDGSLTYTFVPADTVSLDTGNYIGEVHVVYNSGVEYRTTQPFIFRIIERVKT